MMRIFVFTIFSLLLMANTFAQKDFNLKNSGPLSIGETLELESKILGEDRVLDIYLPHGYSKDSAKVYPVIYLLDGSIDEDFLHIAGLVQFGSFSWINMIPESIVVGIANVDRKRDFTSPTKIKDLLKEFPTTGGSANFIQFIAKEVQPLIEKNYKVDNVKTLIGQSLGGLLATEILFTQPDLFDNYMIISPSLWWDNNTLLKSTPTPYPSKKSIYIAVGKEGKVMEKDAKKLHEKLTSSKNENTTLFFEFFETQSHGDVLHLAAYKGFERVFGSVPSQRAIDP